MYYSRLPPAILKKPSFLNEKFPSVRYSPLVWEDINFLGEYKFGRLHSIHLHSLCHLNIKKPTCS